MSALAAVFAAYKWLMWRRTPRPGGMPRTCSPGWCTNTSSLGEI